MATLITRSFPGLRPHPDLVMYKSSRMKYFLTALKKTAFSMMALILVLGGSACRSAPAAAPVIQTVVSPKVVTVPVTQDVTQVVTRVVDVPVTETPEPTQPPTPTPDPNATPAAASLPQASLPTHTDCLYGPADWYEYKSSFTAGQQLDVVGNPLANPPEHISCARRGLSREPLFAPILRPA